MNDWKERIKERFKANCRFDFPAKDITTYRIGGPVDALVYPENREDMKWLVKFVSAGKMPFFVLGSGSNVLVGDKGIRGVVALTGKMDQLEVSGSAVKAMSGAKWDKLVQVSAENGLTGLEKTSGIPGSVGGSVVMNAGAFGQETFDRLVSFEALDEKGNLLVLKKTDVKYSYRKVEGIRGLIIISAAFEFEKGDKSAVLAARKEALKKRMETQPLDSASAGSVFKRPQGDYASRLIDACGLKGLTIGGAQVSAKHAGFIINLGNASASDIYKLIRKVKTEVKIKTGVELELEQILVGDF
ncbi:MAG: UDP-N-acetylmuramate dehydrogenase [Elusimicrobia bacterium]|nr:UDP-N-acetylmuramate dehydrogenase [Elusimicrobiota bacterium]